MATATAPKPPKRVLPANLGKTSNAASKTLSALASPAAVKLLGILTTGQATAEELAKLIAPSPTLIDDLTAGLVKAKLVIKFKEPKAPVRFGLTEAGSKAWAAVQSLA